MKVVFLFAIVCGLLLPSTKAEDIHHPLVKPFAGAETETRKRFEYFEATLPLSTFENSNYDQVATRAVEGRFTYNRYSIENTSALEIYKNYLAAFKKQGFEIEFTCAPKACGYYVEDYLENYSALNKLSPMLNERSAYIVAKFNQNGKQASALFAVSDSLDPVNFYQVVIDEYKPDFNKVAIDAKGYEKFLQEIPAKTSARKNESKDVEGAQDHPLISRFTGSALTRYTNFGYEEIALPIGKIDDDENPTVLTAKGSAKFYRYKSLNGVSLVEVEKSYQNAFKQGEFEMLFQCRKKACGDQMERFLESNKVFKGFQPTLLGDIPVYVVRHKTQYANTLMLITFADWNSYVDVYQAVIQESAVDNNQVQVNADYLQDQISANGKVALYGINFNYDSDKMTKESLQPLAAIAEFLNKNSNLSLYVVGHTDADGNEDYNQQLSLKRAKAVTEKLIKEFGVARSRLTPKGVGNLVPVASNKLDDGKRLNRRVELVEKL
ncbi:OmpA family protein [Pleionea litopenaei]|uniref:OmpA family protein n=1 Tax=Pleionea litopenaei TaxID=3070815 RepID=A0AA51RTB4_9GAMM|nr:OmpA family protein [Pleionea sp. HL-JVS1]WMS87241.1 OmpA family protein [Pleionea sp. HL-JVS1]